MLAIDVGNTHITSAIFDGPAIRNTYRVPTETCIKSGLFFKHLPLKHDNLPVDVVISSVRKSATEVILRDCTSRQGIKPLLIDRETPMGIVNLYKTKETLGIDRLVNAAAAYHLYCKKKNPLIIVDMGTATTIDYVTGSGDFLGGAIAPGMISSYHGLIASAPELPAIESLSISSVIGTTTDECIKSGVIVGHFAMVKGMVEFMAHDQSTKPDVIITGGLSEVLEKVFPEDYILDKDLTLKGLNIIFNIAR